MRVGNKTDRQIAGCLTRWPGLIEHYRRFLPVTRSTPVVTLNEGNTPLIESARDRLAARP